MLHNTSASTSSSVSAAKSAQQKSASHGLLLHESTAGFVQRLRTRGYAINFQLRDFLIRELEANKSRGEDHSAFWQGVDSHWTLRRQQFTPSPDSTLPPELYCTLLCGLHDFHIDYVNLVAVLYEMSALEIRNFYRYCYLEWIARHPTLQQNATSAHGWPCAPREFKTLPVEQLRVKWAETLRMLLGREPLDVADSATASLSAAGTSWSRRTRSLFFVNRLYSYLTPCG